MRYSSLILSAMLIITFTACNKGGKENDIAHETPISEETTMTIGSTETTSTAQITSAMSTKPITTVIKTETTPSTRVAIKDVFDISEKTNQMDWLETFEVPIAISKPDEDTAYFFCHLNYKFTNGSWQEGMIEYLGGREFWEEFTALSGAVPIISTDLLDYPNDFSFIIKYDVP
ncbi:MAG: hypothetical protein FWG83_07860, partial [Oscillospiraceae bacterium]|nr:hypothetical protein [Oscillospiraceae bacterium]